MIGLYILTIIITIMAQRYLRQDLERTLIEQGVKDIGKWMNDAVTERIERIFAGKGVEEDPEYSVRIIK